MFSDPFYTKHRGKSKKMAASLREILIIPNNTPEKHSEFFSDKNLIEKIIYPTFYLCFVSVVYCYLGNNDNAKLQYCI